MKPIDEDVGDVQDDLWNETIDDETVDNEDDDPTYGTNEKELEKDIAHGTIKRFRRRIKRENGETELNKDDVEAHDEGKEEDTKDDVAEADRCEEILQTDADEEWNAIAGQF